MADMKTDDISPIIREKAPLILAEIDKAKSILLHCHPSPDPDSVGSALAMKFALEGMGKKVTIVSSDSDIPKGFLHFPGASNIIQKSFFDLDLKDFDLFLIQDSGSINMISKFKPISFPLPIRTIVIDHHPSNPGYADINLVEPNYPAVAQILFDLFSLWGVEITKDIAANLFIGIYADTGGFRYEGTTRRTFLVAGELTKIATNFPELISKMENSNEPGDIAFEGLALSSVEIFLNGKLGLSAVSNSQLREKGINQISFRADMISAVLRSVAEWYVSGTLIEIEPNKVKASFRSKDGNKYDVSKLAVVLGGGGHKGAAGTTIDMPLAEAKALVVSKAKELYNL
jgi:phosphoesterase RecJ-like protein